eukprot:XP_011665209.1 PREDICTED: serine/arginine repetitive matrix protein 1-like isoform X2 [Strongylocentrotus purpuratus]
MFPNQKAVRSKDLNQRRALSQNVGQSLRSVHHTPSNRQGDGETYFRPTIAAASRSSRKEAAPKTSTAPSSQPPPEDQKKNTTLNQHQRIGKHAGREDNRKEYLRPRQNQASHNTSTNVTSTSPPPYSDEPSTESRTNVRYGPILPPTPDKTAKRRWSVCDDMDGEQLDSIAKGMMSNVRLPKQKKGVKIAGRRIGKAKRKRRKKENDAEASTSECRSKTKKLPKKAKSGHTPSKQNGDGEATSDLPSPQHQGHHQEKKRRRRRRQRPLPQPPPEGQVRRNEKLHKLATNPCHLDPAMEHNKTVYKQFGGHSTVFTEPQVKIRRRRRSNSVKDPQMDFDH